MKEVKNPRKPLLYYYVIVMVVLILINLIVAPMIEKGKIEEVDYGKFMTAINNKKIEKVQIEDNQIMFTQKGNETVYKTGLMDDPTLTQRLYDSGAKFSKDITEETSPVLSAILSFVIPLLIFIWLGRYMSKKLV